MASIPRIVPCLWFAQDALAAAEHYTSIFPNSRISTISYYPEGGPMAAGTVLTVMFELDGHTVTALNGGAMFTFNEALSLQVMCDTQAEIDHYWNKLGEGGPDTAQQCGWLKDQFGLSWQVVPRSIAEWLGPDASAEARSRVMAALLQMKKLDMAALSHAYNGC